MSSRIPKTLLVFVAFYLIFCVATGAPEATKTSPEPPKPTPPSASTVPPPVVTHHHHNPKPTDANTKTATPPAGTNEKVAPPVSEKQQQQQLDPSTAAETIQEDAYAAVPTSDDFETFNPDDVPVTEHIEPPIIEDDTAETAEQEKGSVPPPQRFNETIFAIEFALVQKDSTKFAKNVERVAGLLTELEHAWLPSEDWSEEIAKHADDDVDEGEDAHEPSLRSKEAHHHQKKPSSPSSTSVKKTDEIEKEFLLLLNQLAVVDGSNANTQPKGCGDVDTLHDDILSQEAELREQFSIHAQLANDAFATLNKLKLSHEGSHAAEKDISVDRAKLKALKDQVAVQQRLERLTSHYSRELESASQWSLKAYREYYACHEASNLLEDVVGRWGALKAVREEEQEL